MPPPMPNPTKRMTANPARPVGRYRPGKPVAGQESSEEDESEEEVQQQQQPRPQTQPRGQPRQHTTRHAEESEDEDEEGFVTDPEDEEDQLRAGNQRQAVRITPNTSQRTSVPQPTKPPDPQDSNEAEDLEGSSNGEEEEEEDSTDEDSSSEEEEPRRRFQRPNFIKKSDREQSRSTPTSILKHSPNSPTTTSGPSEPLVDTHIRRLAEAELFIKDKLERDVLARAQGKKAWDDDADVLPESLVDDTDGLDPEAELAAWKVRELKRLKRDREALGAREKELEELDRRRNLTTEEREREDREYIDKQKEEREATRSSDAQYLAQYHHKGAFFQGDEASEILKRRDVMGARFEDQVTDKSTLPEYLRLRDMTKLGKKGRTRYTDLKGQDTGRFGEDVKRWRGSGSANDKTDGGQVFDTRGLDERFLPDDERRGGSRSGPTGANASAVGSRREKERDYGRNEHHDRNRDQTHDGDPYRREGRHYGRRRSYSRSRSPRRKHSRSQSPIPRKRRHIEDSVDRERTPDGERNRETSRRKIEA